MGTLLKPTQGAGDKVKIPRVTLSFLVILTLVPLVIACGNGVATEIIMEDFVLLKFEEPSMDESYQYNVGDTMIINAIFKYFGTGSESYDVRVFMDEHSIFSTEFEFNSDTASNRTNQIFHEYEITSDMESGTHEVRIGTVIKVFTVGDISSVGESGSGLTAGEEEEEPVGEQEEEEYYNLIVTSSDGGSVTSPSEGSHIYDEDEIINLVAEAEEGYQFDRWEGDVADPESASITITMNADKSVMAYFEPIPPFELTSSAFIDGEQMPSIYSRDGGDVSPPLEWTGIPESTQSFVLIMKDPVGWDGTGCVHWIVFNIPADVTSLVQGASSNLPEGALQGTGDDAFGYYGCEPLPGQLHEYHFTIYALDTMLDLSQGATEQTLLNAMEGHIIDQAVLVSTYQG